jgi:hypothetical protein
VPSRRRAGRGQGRQAATLLGMHPIVLLGPLSDLRHSPTDGFSDSPEAFEYRGSHACVRFDKATGTVTLDPPEADPGQLLVEMQALATRQEAEERAALRARLAQRPY